jgi:hypothetical protein
MNKSNNKNIRTLKKSALKDASVVKKDTKVLDRNIRTGHPRSAQATAADMQQSLKNMDMALSQLDTLIDNAKTQRKMIGKQRSSIKSLMARVRLKK